MFKRIYLITVVLYTLTACTTTSPSNDFSDEGLKDIRPFPNPNDVCVLLANEGPVKRLYQSGYDFIACPKKESGAIADRMSEGAEPIKEIGEYQILRRAHDPSKRQPTGYLQAPVDQTPVLYKDTTIVFSDRSHGTQIEYFGDDGEVVLWYPTNRSGLPGQVSFIGTGKGQQICFRYQSAGRNPVTGVVGYAWECGPISSSQNRIKHVLKGDPFNLQSKKLPFVIESKSNLTLKEILTRASISYSAVETIK